MGICYGYDRGDAPGDRIIYGVANWGPGFDGAYSWDEFAESIGIFGTSEGLLMVERAGDPRPPTTVLEMIARIATQWQKHHPAVRFGRQQEEYGLAAFRRYSKDVANPAVCATVKTPYINCHALLFQHNGRYWLGTYLMAIAGELPASERPLVVDTASAYLHAHELLKRFQETNILEGRSEDEITEAISWLEEAYEAEAQVVKNLERLLR
jgi:hypothetical protein